MPLHPDIRRLSDALKMMTALLNLYGNEHCADELGRCRAIIDQSDFYGVERLLGLYGGMGSLNDVVLQRQGLVDRSDNEAFDKLRSDVWAQALALARDESV